MNKILVREYLAALQEFVNQKKELPTRSLRHWSGLSKFYKALDNLTQEYVAKMHKALHPVPGQLLTPEKVEVELKIFAGDISFALKFAEKIILNQAWALRSQDEELAKLRRELDQLQASAMRTVKRTRPSKRKPEKKTTHRR